MSKSLGNAIALKDAPGDMFGKIMSIPDTLMLGYFTYLTGMNKEEVRNIRRDLESGALHPREAKVALAKRIVGLYHSTHDAERAGEAFDKVFRDHGFPEEMPEVLIGRDKTQQGRLDVISLLQTCRLTQSRSEARRLIQQGGVKINQRKVLDEGEIVPLEGVLVVQCGKRKFARIRLSS